jgi:hypothetical protein
MVYMRTLITAALLVASIAGPARAQTQPTGPSASSTNPTDTSAYPRSARSPCYSSIDPNSPCYSGTEYPSYSAIPLPESSPPAAAESNRQAAAPGADSLNEGQAKARIEAKGYSNISELQKDDRGIWRGQGTMKDGRAVAVILDLEGNVYSEIR